MYVGVAALQAPVAHLANVTMESLIRCGFMRTPVSRYVAVHTILYRLLSSSGAPSFLRTPPDRLESEGSASPNLRPDLEPVSDPELDGSFNTVRSPAEQEIMRALRAADKLTPPFVHERFEFRVDRWRDDKWRPVAICPPCTAFRLGVSAGSKWAVTARIADISRETCLHGPGRHPAPVL